MESWKLLSLIFFFRHPLQSALLPVWVFADHWLPLPPPVIVSSWTLLLSGRKNERQQRAAKWMETNDALIELSGRQAANKRILLGHENCMTLDFILVIFFLWRCLFSSFHDNDTEALVRCEEQWMWWHTETSTFASHDKCFKYSFI